MIMLLKELLPNRQINIEYRTHTPDGTDVFTGACKWTGSELVPLDGDEYFVDDIISNYEWNSDSELTIWYESKWI